MNTGKSVEWLAEALRRPLEPEMRNDFDLCVDVLLGKLADGMPEEEGRNARSLCADAVPRMNSEKVEEISRALTEMQVETELRLKMEANYKGLNAATWMMKADNDEQRAKELDAVVDILPSMSSGALKDVYQETIVPFINFRLNECQRDRLGFVLSQARNGREEPETTLYSHIFEQHTRYMSYQVSEATHYPFDEGRRPNELNEHSPQDEVDRYHLFGFDLFDGPTSLRLSEEQRGLTLPFSEFCGTLASASPQIARLVFDHSIRRLNWATRNRSDCMGDALVKMICMRDEEERHIALQLLFKVTPFMSSNGLDDARSQILSFLKPGDLIELGQTRERALEAELAELREARRAS